MNMLAKLVSGPVTQTEWREIRLQRDGAPPLRFAGRLLARHRGGAPEMTAWHDLALYGTAAGQFVVEIVAWAGLFGGNIHRSRTHALHAVTLEAALNLFETHDPLGDLWPDTLPPATGFESPARAVAQLSLEVAALHATCHDMMLQYRGAVGQLLARLAWMVV